LIETLIEMAERLTQDLHMDDNLSQLCGVLSNQELNTTEAAADAFRSFAPTVFVLVKQRSTGNRVGFLNDQELLPLLWRGLWRRVLVGNCSVDVGNSVGIDALTTLRHSLRESGTSTAAAVVDATKEALRPGFCQSIQDLQGEADRVLADILLDGQNKTRKQDGLERLFIDYARGIAKEQLFRNSMDLRYRFFSFVHSELLLLSTCVSSAGGLRNETVREMEDALSKKITEFEPGLFAGEVDTVRNFFAVAVEADREAKQGIQAMYDAVHAIETEIALCKQQEEVLLGKRS